MTGLATLTALHWDGPLPLPGHVVRTPAGRTAYIVVEVIRAKPGLKHVAKFRCERMRIDRVPPGAVTYDWYWSKR